VGASLLAKAQYQSPKILQANKQTRITAFWNSAHGATSAILMPLLISRVPHA
jgi:hypothetical protein